MYRYVKIDTDGYPVEDFWYSDKVEEKEKILIPTDFNLTNKQYVNNEWIDKSDPYAQNIIDETTELDLETKMNIQYLVDLAEINQEVAQ